MLIEKSYSDPISIIEMLNQTALIYMMTWLHKGAVFVKHYGIIILYMLYFLSSNLINLNT